MQTFRLSGSFGGPLVGRKHLTSSTHSVFADEEGLDLALARGGNGDGTAVDDLELGPAQAGVHDDSGGRARVLPVSVRNSMIFSQPLVEESTPARSSRVTSGTYDLEKQLHLPLPSPDVVVSPSPELAPDAPVLSRSPSPQMVAPDQARNTPSPSPQNQNGHAEQPPPQATTSRLPSSAAPMLATDTRTITSLDAAQGGRVAPAELTIRGTFCAPDVEVEFVRTVLYPLFTARVLVASALLAGFWTALLAVEMSHSGTAGAEAVAHAHRLGTVASICLVCALSALALGGLGALCRARPVARLGMVEGAATLVFATHCFALAILFSPERLRAVLGSAPARTPEWRFSPTDALVAQLLVPTLVASFVPLQIPAFSLMCIAVLGQSVSMHAAIGERTPMQDWPLAMFALVIICLFAGRVHSSMSMRGTFHLLRTTRATHRQLIREAAERRRLEAKDTLQRSEMMAQEAATTARSNLIRMVMHDLRSPLLSVTNLTLGLRQKPPEETLGSKGVSLSLSALSTCATLMESIVSDMLDFERIDSGRLVLVKAPFFPSQLLRDALATFAGLARGKGVMLTVDKVPESLLGKGFIGDSRRLQQCLNNGVSNAIKFTERGGSVTVSVREEVGDLVEGADQSLTRQRQGHARGNQAEAFSPRRASEEELASTAPGAGRDKATAASLVTAATGDMHPDVSEPPERWSTLVVEVKDTGMGLTEEELATLNDSQPFLQVGQGQLQASGGTGLGLNITRSILNLHDGSQLLLTSAGRGRGVTFSIILQLKVDTTPQETNSAAPSRDELTSMQRMLSDSPAGGIRDASGLLVQRRKARAHAATVGAEALGAMLGDVAGGDSQAARTPKGIKRSSRALTGAVQMDAPPAPAHDDAHSASIASAAQAAKEQVARASASSSWEDQTSHTATPKPRSTSLFEKPSAPLIDDGDASPSQFHCLFVDDDAFLRLTVPPRIFAEEGMVYDVASDGKEALDMVTSEGSQYHAVVIDNQMPVMPGHEATRRMRAAGYQGLVIGLTGAREHLLASSMARRKHACMRCRWRSQRLPMPAVH